MMQTDLPESEQKPAAPPPQAKRRRRRPRPLLIVVDILILIIAAAGVYFLLRGWLTHRKQDQLTEQLRQIDLGPNATLVVQIDDLPMDGIDGGYDELETEEDFLVEEPTVPSTPTSSLAPTSSLTPSVSDSGSASEVTEQPVSTAPPTDPATVTSTTTTKKQQVIITRIGRIILPKIKVDMPIAEGATSYTLSVAIGHYRNSAALGQPGLCVLLGHRMYSYGRHFNRLGEMALGDEIIIEDHQNRYIYQVDRIDRILPAEMGREFRAAVEGSRIMLVTCDPIRVASHRLLVKGNLIKTIPLSQISKT